MKAPIIGLKYTLLSWKPFYYVIDLFRIFSFLPRFRRKSTSCH